MLAMRLCAPDTRREGVRVAGRGRSPIYSPADLVVTGEMREAGAAVLFELEGEASKEYQAQQVFEAMLLAHVLSN